MTATVSSRPDVLTWGQSGPDLVGVVIGDEYNVEVLVVVSKVGHGFPAGRIAVVRFVLHEAGYPDHIGDRFALQKVVDRWWSFQAWKIEAWRLGVGERDGEDQRKCERP